MTDFIIVVLITYFLICNSCYCLCRSPNVIVYIVIFWVQHLRHHHNQAYTALLGESVDDIASSSKQQKLDSFINSSASIILQITIMIAKDLQPFSVVEDYGIRNLVKRLAPHYIIPTRKHIRQVVIELYNEEKSNLQKILSKEIFIHITTDLWTDTKTFLSYLGMTFN